FSLPQAQRWFEWQGGSVMDSGPSVTVDAVLGEDEAIGSAIGPRVWVQVRVRGWLPGPTRLRPAASVARQQVDM
ncbi:hypothetical protein BC826DRAFT_1069006, partial [Russula brevipes]